MRRETLGVVIAGFIEKKEGSGFWEVMHFFEDIMALFLSFSVTIFVVNRFCLFFVLCVVSIHRTTIATPSCTRTHIFP